MLFVLLLPQCIELIFCANIFFFFVLWKLVWVKVSPTSYGNINTTRKTNTSNREANHFFKSIFDCWLGFSSPFFYAASPFFFFFFGSNWEENVSRMLNCASLVRIIRVEEVFIAASTNATFEMYVNVHWKLNCCLVVAFFKGELSFHVVGGNQSSRVRTKREHPFRWLTFFLNDSFLNEMFAASNFGCRLCWLWWVRCDVVWTHLFLLSWCGLWGQRWACFAVVR